MSHVYCAHVFAINEIIRNAVRTVYPDMPNTEVMQYSTHSVRVWACVSLDEAGESPDFIQKRLRWIVESYRVYLRDTNKINQQHNHLGSSMGNLCHASLEP